MSKRKKRENIKKTRKIDNCENRKRKRGRDPKKTARKQKRNILRREKKKREKSKRQRHREKNKREKTERSGWYGVRWARKFGPVSELSPL